MTSPRYARLAARALAHGLVNEPDGSAPAATVARSDRGAAIDAIERALRAKAQRRARGRWAAGLGAAAAAIALVGGAARFAHLTVHAQTAGAAPAGLSVASVAAPGDEAAAVGSAPTVVGRATGGDVTVTAPGSNASVADGKPLAAGSRVIARAGGRALLAFATGTRLTVEEGSDMTIVEEGATQVFSLAGGAMRADVAKLAEGQRFLVRTADAEVEVRGTSFRVAVAPADPGCGGGTTTRVAVYEGSVIVRREGMEARVAKGESWPLHCASSEHARGRLRASGPGSGLAGIASAGAGGGSGVSSSGAGGSVARGAGNTGPSGAGGAAPALLGAGAPQAAVGGGASSAATGPSTSAVSGSGLAIQNDRFAAAIAAKRSGDSATAIAGFERFLAAYPGSPLAESALVERMKLLAASDPARGASAAKQYLARYPGGFARAEAEAIAAERR